MGSEGILLLRVFRVLAPLPGSAWTAVNRFSGGATPRVRRFAARCSTAGRRTSSVERCSTAKRRVACCGLVLRGFFAPSTVPGEKPLWGSCHASPFRWRLPASIRVYCYVLRCSASGVKKLKQISSSGRNLMCRSCSRQHGRSRYSCFFAGMCGQDGSAAGSLDETRRDCHSESTESYERRRSFYVRQRQSHVQF